jgi:hypothetical protein
MTFSRLGKTVLVAALFCFGAIGSHADEPAVPAGWTSLFNGKDLTGWKASEGVEWKVEEGCIVTPPKRSHLFTDTEFTNFEFKADVQTTPGSNSGIYFHTKYEDTFPNTGYECQVNQTHGDPVKSGSLYNVVKVFESAAKDDEWYTTHIIVKKKNITIHVNGKKLYEYVEPEGVTGGRKLSRGSFALQAHDPKSVVRYRNIMVKVLPD